MPAAIEQTRQRPPGREGAVQRIPASVARRHSPCGQTAGGASLANGPARGLGHNDSTPANTTAVYRVFDQRLDANHRYMTDKNIRGQMVGYAWLAEGDGPDLVVMCAP